MSTYFIAPTGNNSNAGTEEAPWLTIQKAVDTMVAGDTTLVKHGTYVAGGGNEFIRCTLHDSLPRSSCAVPRVNDNECIRSSNMIHDIDVHITEITSRGVYGHDMRHCDPAGCAATSASYLAIPAEGVAVGCCYTVRFFDPVGMADCHVIAAIE